MLVVVVAGDERQKEFKERAIPPGITVCFVTDIEDVKSSAEAFFYLHDEEKLPYYLHQLQALQAPVFVNAVATTLKDLPSNCIRLNAWPGFLPNDRLEISCSQENLQHVSNIMNALKWDFIMLPDIAGMFTPRTISMIVNEGYFALQEEISSKKEIDIAMRLGTNYPYGPFEWSEKIGLKKIYNLLEQLAHTDKRYVPAPLLVKEVKH
jgi:3-hydroxybutyryl-CoA dehydrogenase